MIVILKPKAEESHTHSSGIVCDSSLAELVQNDRALVLWGANGTVKTVLAWPHIAKAAIRTQSLPVVVDMANRHGTVKTVPYDGLCIAPTL